MKYQVMIQGSTMAVVFTDLSIQQEVTKFLLEADSVILYRSSPSQKAELVDLMKKSTNQKKFCAIGDGANDVMMLQKADVGIGIMGKEGNQASSFADFGVA